MPPPFGARSEPARQAPPAREHHAGPVDSTTGMATAAAQALSGGQSVEMCPCASAADAEASGAPAPDGAPSAENSAGSSPARLPRPWRRRSFPAAAAQVTPEPWAWCSAAG